MDNNEEYEEFYDDYKDELKSGQLKAPIDNLGDMNYSYTGLETFEVKLVESTDEEVTITDIRSKKSKSGGKLF